MEADADTGNTLVDPASPARVATPATRIAIGIGSMGLVIAMATDAIAVLGRHTGFALLGSIEVVQVAIVLLASASLVIATIEGRHAAVHILTERLSAPHAAHLAGIAALLATAFFALLAIGGAWLMSDLWAGHERSELLHIPFRVLRLIFTAALVVVTLLFLRAALVRHRGDPR